MSTPPPPIEPIIEYVKDKMNNVSSSYDDKVVLGTCLVILQSNPAYVTYFSTVNNNTNFYNETQAFDNFFKANTLNTYGFAKKLFLKETNTGTESSTVTTNIEFEFVNSSSEKGIGIKFDNLVNDINSFDEVATKTNFQTKFVSLAQVLYECGFETVVQKLTITDNTNSTEANESTLKEINKLIAECSTTLKKATAKTLHVIYCNGATKIAQSTFTDADFAKMPNVKFSTNKIVGKCISATIDALTKTQASKQTVIFLDGLSFLKKDEILKIKEAISSDMFVQIIIYDSKLDGTKIGASTEELKNAANIKFTLINKGDLSSGQATIIRQMFRGADTRIYNFSVNEDTSYPNLSVTFDKTSSNDKIKEFLEYYLFSNIIVDIREL